MQRVEELIRESLQARAQDVEPTPALWREVDRRVARRSRFQVLTWSLAGATAALAAVLAVPAILAQVTGGTPDIDIRPLERTPAAGVVPELYVTDVDGTLEVRDLGSDERRSPEVTADDGRFGDAADELAVRPGSTREDGAVAAIRGSDTPSPVIEVATIGAGTDDEHVSRQSLAHALADENALRGFRPSVTWMPDQDLVAFTMPVEDQTKLVLWQPGETTGELTTSRMVTREPGLVFGVGEVELLDWAGSTTSTGDESVLYFRDDRGVHTLPLTRRADGSMSIGDDRLLDGVYDVASSHADAGVVDAPRYEVALTIEGPALRWTDGAVGIEVPLDWAFGEVDLATVWLDAKQDAVLVGDGKQTLLFTHDGQGVFADPVELDTAGPAALLDAARPTEEGPAPAPTEEPDEGAPEPTPAPGDPADEDPADEESVADGGVAGDGTGSGPVVTVTERDLILHGPDGEQVLYTLPAEGESTFISARVRPGSTLGDLTIVALHRAEGMNDFRTYRYVDGELSVEYWNQGRDPRPDLLPVAPDGGTFGPVWSPAGDKLAWIELASDGTPQLRIIGWDDGPGTHDPATDNAMWSLDELSGAAPMPVDWVDLGDGRTEIRVVTEAGDGWVAIPVEIQGDGAPALPPGSTVERRGSGAGGPVRGLAGTMETGAPRWLLQGDRLVFDPEGEAREVTTLPSEEFPDGAAGAVWMRAAGSGVILGGDEGRAIHVAPDGEIGWLGNLVVDGDALGG